MRRSHVLVRGAVFALVVLSAAVVAPASALGDSLAPSLPTAVPLAGTPSVSVAASVPTLATPTVSANVAASASVTASGPTQATQPAATHTAREPNRAVRAGHLHARAHRVRTGAPAQARSLAATLSCPLPGPKTAVHCTNVPLDGALTDECNSAEVFVSGTIQFTTTVTVDIDKITITTRENFQNVSGFGTNGAQYQANDKDVTQIQFVPFSFFLVIPIDQQQELITIQPAQLPNQILHVHEDVTVDINPLDGTPTISGQVAKPDMRCTR